MKENVFEHNNNGNNLNKSNSFCHLLDFQINVAENWKPKFQTGLGHSILEKIIFISAKKIKNTFKVKFKKLDMPILLRYHMLFYISIFQERNS